ncbi:MAG TPA: 2-dehydropantoate 2-reductase [Usitatibacter sp.]|nr:2-dehydropantoate 2-reductase [Usitatibacter sp.]
MRFCVIGAGAIGGFVGARLALGGHDVTFLARGRTLEAIRAGGIEVREPDGSVHRAAVRAIDAAEGKERFDVVMLALKAYDVAAVASRVEPLCHDETMVVPLQNGIPFWYFNDHGGPLAGTAIESVDPGGRIRDAIPAHRIVGAVVYAACEQAAPGKIVHVNNQRLILGEPDGSTSARIQALAVACEDAGFQAPVIADIRNEIWLKVWGNLSFNPVSALTGATLSGICTDPQGRELVAQMMREASEVAAKLGVAFRMSIDKRIEGARRVGAHKTSMLQDVEAGRAMEVDALVGSVVELGGLVGVATPTISAIYRAAKLLDATRRNGAALSRR